MNCEKASENILVGFLFFIGVTLALAAGVGWVLNIVKLVPMDGATGMLVLRGAGIVIPPLGMVLGYIS